MVLLDKFICRDDGFPKHPLAGLDVIRINVGQRLQHSHGDRELADAADVLSDIGTVFGIPGMARI